MIRILRAAALAAAITLFGFQFAAAAEPAEAPLTKAQQAELDRLQGVLDSQHPQFGDVRLSGPGVTLHLGKRFYFLDAAEAKQVLKEWGNPPSSMDGVLGIVFPAGKQFLDDDAWGAVVTFDPSGYVSDKDVDKVDYDKMIADAQAAEKDENAELEKKGFRTSHLVGWAQPPSYDRTRHTLIWARDIKFAGADDDSLNYDLRILGRKGVLSLNLVSTMPRLAQVRADAAQLAAAASFDKGDAYGDFQPDRDKAAEYGVAGLVAGGLGVAAAQKLGLFALLLVFAKKAFVLVAAGAAGAWAWVRRRLGLAKRKPPAAAIVEAPPEEPRDAA
jgi:uncharacterized membrane-anchored protein